MVACHYVFAQWSVWFELVLTAVVFRVTLGACVSVFNVCLDGLFSLVTEVMQSIMYAINLSI